MDGIDYVYIFISEHLISKMPHHPMREQRVNENAAGPGPGPGPGLDLESEQVR